MSPHSKAEKFFTKDEKEKLKAVTREVESRTIGEIVTMVVDRSDHYIEAEVLGGVLLGWDSNSTSASPSASFGAIPTALN